MKRSSTRLLGAITPLLLVVLVANSADAVDARDSVRESIAFPRTGPTVAYFLELGAMPGIVEFGTHSTLFGKVRPSAAGTSVVDIFARATTDLGYSKVASVATTRGGTYTLNVTPRIQTTYRAEYQSGSTRVVSRTVTLVAVRPAVALEVTLVRYDRLSFTATVTSAHNSYEGRYVLVQRRDSAGRWTTIKRATLGADSTTRFSARINAGESPIRALLTTSQAGPGYVSSASRSIDPGAYRLPIME